MVYYFQYFIMPFYLYEILQKNTRNFLFPFFPLSLMSSFRTIVLYAILEKNARKLSEGRKKEPTNSVR